MYSRLLGAALALALMAYPAQAMKMKPEDANNALATCVASLLLIGLPIGCAKAKLSNASAKGKAQAQVTIHKPEGGKCANGNTYRIMRVSNPRSVCKNSFKHGSAAPACANISGRNGNAHTIIIVNKAGAHLAHEIKHACDVNWNH